MLIFIQFCPSLLKDKTLLPLDMEPSDSIEKVKQKIHEAQGILPEYHYLVFKGKKLENDRNLSEYTIPNESTLYAVRNNRGG